MKCAVCGGAELVPNSSQLIPFVWLGQETMLECRGDLCPACGEMLLTEEGSAFMGQQIRDFKQKVKQELDSQEYIVSVRKKLGLSQKQAGELFGGGVNAFSRYENGKVSPPLSLVQLFRLLERQPELLKVLCAMPSPLASTSQQRISL